MDICKNLIASLSASVLRSRPFDDINDKNIQGSLESLNAKINNLPLNLTLTTLNLPATSGDVFSDFNRLKDIAGTRTLDSGISSSGAWLQSRDSSDYSINYPLLLQPNGGDVLVGGSLSAVNFSDNHLNSNINLGSGNIEGRGLVAGFSGGMYGGIGYNLRHTNTTGLFINPLPDYGSYLTFYDGGIKLFTFPTGLANRTTDISSAIPLLYVARSGNTGIGVESPDRKLVIDGDLGFYYSAGSSYNGIRRSGVSTVYFNNITGISTAVIHAFTNASDTNVLTITNGGSVIASGSIASVGIGLNTGPVSSGTDPTWLLARNTGGDFFIGKEGSTPGGYFSGTAAYDNVLYGSGAIKVIVDGVASSAFTSSGLAVTGTQSTTGQITSSDSVRISKAGSNTFGSGPYLYLSNVAGTAGVVQQLNASNGLDWFNAASGSSPIANLSLVGNFSAIGNVDAGVSLNIGTSGIGGQLNYFGDASGYFEYVNRMGSNKGFRWYTGAGASAIGMTLDANGNLLVGVSSGGYHTFKQSSDSAIPALYIESAAATSTNQYGLEVGLTGDPNNTTNYFIALTGNGTTRCVVYSNGNIQNTNNSYGAISDIKLKENIEDATPKLAKLLQVRVVNYNLKSDPTFKQIGVIAQELENVFPGMIDETPSSDGLTKSVKYSLFVLMLIKSMQEQHVIIEDAITRLSTLESDKAILLDVLASIDTRLLALEAS